MGRIRRYDSDGDDSVPRSPSAPPMSPPRSPQGSAPRSPAGPVSPPRSPRSPVYSASPARDPNEVIVIDVGADDQPRSRKRREDRARRSPTPDDKRRERRLEELERRDQEREERRKKKEEQRARDDERRKRREEEREKREEERRKRDEERRERERQQREAERVRREEEKKKRQDKQAQEKALRDISPFVCVTNVDRSVQPDHLRDIFNHFDLTLANINRKTNAKQMPLDEVVIEFSTPDDAKKAIDHMHDGYINGRRVRLIRTLPRKPKTEEPVIAEAPAAEANNAENGNAAAPEAAAANSTEDKPVVEEAPAEATEVPASID